MNTMDFRACLFVVASERFNREMIIIMETKRNDGTERDIEGVGWDMSILPKLFLVLDGNGNAFPEMSAQSGAYFQLRIVNVEIPFSIILKLAFINKLYLHAICHYFAFTKNIRSRSALMRTSRKT